MINRLTEFLKYQGRSFCSWSQLDRNVRRFNKIIFLWWKYTQSSVYRDGTENDTDFTQVWIMWSLELVKAKPLLNRTKYCDHTVYFIRNCRKKERKEKKYLQLIELKKSSRQTRTAKVPRDHNIPAIFHQASLCFNMARKARSWNNVSIYFDIF